MEAGRVTVARAGRVAVANAAAVRAAAGLGRCWWLVAGGSWLMAIACLKTSTPSTSAMISSVSRSSSAWMNAVWSLVAMQLPVAVTVWRWRCGGVVVVVVVARQTLRSQGTRTAHARTVVPFRGRQPCA